jgi:hypothetical protein
MNHSFEFNKYKIRLLSKDEIEIFGDFLNFPIKNEHIFIFCMHPSFEQNLINAHYKKSSIFIINGGPIFENNLCLKPDVFFNDRHSQITFESIIYQKLSLSVLITNSITGNAKFSDINFVFTDIIYENIVIYFQQIFLLIKEIIFVDLQKIIYNLIIESTFQ